MDNSNQLQIIIKYNGQCGNKNGIFKNNYILIKYHNYKRLLKE
jgi:hypothetical protein